MSNKHDANVRKSTLVNFQIGLIASLLFTFVVFETYTSVSVVAPPDKEVDNTEDVSFTMDAFRVEKPKIQKQLVKVKKVKKPLLVEPKKVEERSAIAKLTKELGTISEKGKAKAVPVDSILDIVETKEITYGIDKVTVAPIYPGCEGLSSNDERIACLSSKIKKIVSYKFNADLSAEYGLKGVQKIHVQFQVSKDGSINDVKVRAPHPALEKETRRVVGKFSKMKPGKIGKDAVNVKYFLPITFRIQE
ncbi:hypothetical protein GCM10009430_13820 [Aquimarina litoralis]|uniref:TonB C-terminal domain-containing protein n=1 Tax=Aquimarina litoralis TaxID=584605 RepID=A0ABN1IM23_9FLAO